MILAALVWDLSERATESFPFAAENLDSGQPITPDVVVWREVPRGSLHLPRLDGTTAATGIEKGDPIVPSLVSVAPVLPLDTWAVPVPLPLGAGQGTLVHLVFADGTGVSGIIIQSASEDSLGFKSDGMVAVEGATANAVALAAANGELVVLIRP
jgi:hypothetical protein